MIYPKSPTKKDLLNSLNRYRGQEDCKILYRLLIEFDSNKYTSDLREFILKYYKGEKWKELISEKWTGISYIWYKVW